jgi:phosphatidylserine decarboxylase
MDSPASKADIPRFLRAFEGQVGVEDIEGSIEQFSTFNQFFYRKLKPGARPIAAPQHDEVLTSCADCRLMSFNSVDDATQFWVKVGQHQLPMLRTSDCCCFLRLWMVT